MRQRLRHLPALLLPVMAAVLIWAGGASAQVTRFPAPQPGASGGGTGAETELSVYSSLDNDLAAPLMVILAAQAIVMTLYAAFVTFRIMGKNYDAAVLAAGHCGFGMGATPTAVANMQAITNQYGPSHKAFLIVPLVGAFFIDIINAFVLQAMISIVR